MTCVNLGLLMLNLHSFLVDQLKEELQFHEFLFLLVLNQLNQILNYQEFFEFVFVHILHEQKL